jgi:hypothetical protein
MCSRGSLRILWRQAECAGQRVAILFRGFNSDLDRGRAEWQAMDIDDWGEAGRQDHELV